MKCKKNRDNPETEKGKIVIVCVEFFTTNFNTFFVRSSILYVNIIE
jgi:hypothetical protein